jgi:hypothetical protein
MKTVRQWGGLLALAALFLAGAFGEDARGSDLRIVSSFVAPGAPVPHECVEEAGIFAGALGNYAPPRDWHWVLVCDEAGWRRFLSLSGRSGEDRIYASTDLSARTTYLRGSKLLHTRDFGASPARIIAHELAHIQLHDRDEPTAERLGRWWEKGLIGTGRDAETTRN